MYIYFTLVYKIISEKKYTKHFVALHNVAYQSCMRSSYLIEMLFVLKIIYLIYLQTYVKIIKSSMNFVAFNNVAYRSMHVS